MEGKKRLGPIRKKGMGLFMLMAVIMALIGVQLWGIGDSVVTMVTYNMRDWGLSFGESGTVPRGNADAEELKKLNSYYVAPTEEKIIYLTFDAGYESGQTEQILDALKKHEVPAAFFLVGHYMESCPDLVRRMAKEGHVVANHTMHHPNMSQLKDRAAFEKELTDLEALYYEITGEEMKKFYRPPEGKFSETNLKMAQELGYTTCFWSLAYADWDQNAQPSREEAFHKLLGRIHPGAIVLLHSTSATNAAIMDELITRYKEMGYTFGSLTDLQK
ncbi:MAG: delta-lactam-biosynthetic de-N-acetylase [Clostridiales bacterium]|nr:delta-lactam-biosynthetic de-N-acetylase [Clostridiales bacterium]